MGNEIYFDITGDLFENNSIRLVKRVRQVLGLSDLPPEPAIQINRQNENEAGTSGDDQPAEPGNAFSNWTDKEVQKWLEDSEMDFLTERYEFICF